MLIRRRTLLTHAPIALAAALGPLRARAHGEAHFVTIGRRRFMPETLKIEVGDTVIFYNDDTDPHRALSDTRSFDTGRMDYGDLRDIIIRAPGSHFYKCALTPGMQGNIIAL